MTPVKEIGVDTVQVTDPDLASSCDGRMIMFMQNAAIHYAGQALGRVLGLGNSLVRQGHVG